ncbi:MULTISPECIES: SGNH/GDSL hydrolase family protein [unclassified Bacillus cereus group]|uniref:SGNH/GDSL hydrolase family protein n=1 Tax=unclassified Bacillus cereus group TaxID=2750818 RepID=UPI001F55CFDF|nr:MULTISPECIES: SGNH/GDSL hydrolase family protein [unclassified Bacillus cereus group]
MKIGLIGDSLTEGRPGVSFVNILKRKYPNITFLNFGKPGETVKSLHTRLSKKKLESNFDLIFLWIGTNDVYSKLLKVQAKPIVENHREFNDYFSKLLNMVIPFSKYVVVVSPAIIGENLNNQSNCELRDLSSMIENISKQYLNVSFLDIQSVFKERLANVHSSDYISTSVMTVMKDVLFYKNPVRIDRLSSKRGLHLTLDGIHLNSDGALCVAEEYACMIDQLLFDKSSTIQ